MATQVARHPSFPDFPSRLLRPSICSGTTLCLLSILLTRNMVSTEHLLRRNIVSTEQMLRRNIVSTGHLLRRPPFPRPSPVSSWVRRGHHRPPGKDTASRLPPGRRLPWWAACAFYPATSPSSGAQVAPGEALTHLCHQLCHRLCQGGTGPGHPTEHRNGSPEHPWNTLGGHKVRATPVTEVRWST